MLTINDIPGFKLGHAQDSQGLTGCSVIVAQEGAVAGADVRGSATGSREIDPLRVVHVVDRIHGLTLGGGSAFGLCAASGVMQWLEEHGVGFPVGITRVPIVPGAVIFDLKIGEHTVRPDAQMGYRACEDSGTRTQFPSGCVGAGMGATAGKYKGMEWAMKTGIGQAGLCTDSGLKIAVLVVANPYGDIIDYRTGEVLAGCRFPHGGTQDLKGYHLIFPEMPPVQAPDFTNTVLAAVVTNARMNKAIATKVAQMAQCGIARSILPANSPFDGDIVFVLSQGTVAADYTWLGANAARLVSEAMIDAARSATSCGGFPACNTPPIMI